MPQRKRPDRNTPIIKAAIRECGWEYIDTHNLGDGFPDCLAVRWVGRVNGGRAAYRTEWIEIKAATGRFTPDERAFYMRHPGLVRVCRTREDVYKLLGRPEHETKQKKEHKAV
jgi:hypothetical protein